MSDETLSPQVEFGIVENRFVEGLTPDILSELYQIGRSYGSLLPNGLAALRYDPQTFGIDGSLYITSGTAPGNKSIMVGKSENFVVHQVRTNTGIVLWDQSLSLAEAQEQIEIINARTMDLGLYDPGTGAREELHPIRTQTKIKVDVAFPSKEAWILVPTGKDILEALDEFDHPELLGALETESGKYVIVRKEDLESARRRIEITNQVLKENGIRPEDKVESAVAESLSAEIERRISGETS